MTDIKLSKNFLLSEMTATSHFDLLEDNMIYALDFLKPLTALCASILQPIREHYGLPVRVTSGVRCPVLNEKVGSKSTSQHLKGEAADFIIPGIELVNIWEWVKISGIPYGQNILEKSWIHISLGEPWRPVGKNRQDLIIA